MQATGIEWTDTTWNPLAGCRAYSPGCKNCYAAVMTYRLEMMGQKKYVGLTMLHDNGTRHFNGIVRPDEASLPAPLKWRKPRRVFVNSMSDLFFGDEADRASCEGKGIPFEPVPFEFIDRVFAVMALTPQHTYQVLTKRPGRMAAYFAQNAVSSVADAAKELSGTPFRADEWPLPNVHLGTSVENQQAADERIPHLLDCPAAVRFLSVEPMLGPVDLEACAPYCLGEDTGNPGVVNAFTSMCHHPATARFAPDKAGTTAGISWVIIGSESGPKRRPMQAEWAESIVDQCRAAGVACFMKQMEVGGKVSGDIDSFPPALQVREFPTTTN